MRADFDSNKTNVEVKLFGAMRDLAGRPDLRLTFPHPVTIKELLQKLQTQSPRLMERLNPAIRQGYISVLVNGRRLRSESDFETVLADESIVSFLPPIAGG